MTIPSRYSAAAVCAALLFATPIYGGIEEQKKAYTNIQKTSLDNAFKAAKAGLLKTINALKSPSRSDQNRFIKWFGIGTAADTQSVSKVYETALTLSTISFYWCPNNSIPELVWDVGDIAAVHPSAPGAVFFYS